uniref:Uncharacterized protein n=1 Tax=Amphimedon queenslandica TaxID=400682 RepID=A0A1X7VDK1_AMPQE
APKSSQSPCTIEWDDILRSYERKNLHLAEGAQVMSRLVNYEVASLKRQIARYQQQQKESTRKANDSQTNARSLKIKFEEQCQEFGIEHKKL